VYHRRSKGQSPTRLMECAHRSTSAPSKAYPDTSLLSFSSTHLHQRHAVASCGLQVRSLPDVRVLTDFGAFGVALHPGHELEVQVEVKPRSYGIICTLIMLDFGERRVTWLCRYGKYAICRAFSHSAWWVALLPFLAGTPPPCSAQAASKAQQHQHLLPYSAHVCMQCQRVPGPLLR
jgi:hypothetical protein